MNWWLLYIAIVLVVSGLVGMHLGRFREAYTEMTGMMAGMTMGMLNGFVLGFGAASASNSMFWGNLFGILLGLWLGIYFGRPGGLMGIMDGGMGGVMGGSMGAMLAVMVVFPPSGQLWTALLLMALYALGMVGLVVLIERSAPGHEALHRLAPFFTRAVAQEIEEASEAGPGREAGALQARSGSADAGAGLPPRYHVQRRPVGGSSPRTEAPVDVMTQDVVKPAPTGTASDRPDCCPPPRKNKTVASVAVPVSSTQSAATAVIISTNLQNEARNGIKPKSAQISSPRVSGGNKGSGQRRAGTGATAKQRARYAQPRQRPAVPLFWTVGAAVLLVLIALGVWILLTGGQIGYGEPATGSLNSAANSANSSPPDAFLLSLNTNPSPPQPGPATLTLAVANREGRPVTGAQVRMSMDMTTMIMGPQTGPMTEVGSGKYEAKVDFDMRGPWRVNVDVSKGGQSMSRNFDYRVR
ncbi:MAG: FixH family protein [Chloroflexia bacterium]